MKKLKLEDLKIQSFVTTLKNEDDLMGAGADSATNVDEGCDDSYYCVSENNCDSDDINECTDTDPLECDDVSDDPADCEVLSENPEDCDDEEEDTEFPECPEDEDERYPA